MLTDICLLAAAGGARGRRAGSALLVARARDIAMRQHDEATAMHAKQEALRAKA
jgi:hypothetical protein